MSLSMLGDQFSSQVDLPGFSLRPGVASLNCYSLRAQAFELADDGLRGCALSVVREADERIVGASLRIPRAIIDDASRRATADALLAAFLARVRSPFGPDHPGIGEVWSGQALEREQAVRGRVLMVERVNGPEGPAVRVSWQEAARLERACLRCGAGNLQNYAFCVQCGAPRTAVGALDLPPPPLPPPAEPMPPMVDSASIAISDAPPRLDDSATISVTVVEPGILQKAGSAPILQDPPTIPVLLRDLRGPAPVLQDPPTIPVRNAVSRNVFVPVAPLGASPVPDAWTVREPPPAAPAPLHDHHGEVVRASDDLFVPAPPEIGEVRSAATSIWRGQDKLWRRFVRTLPWALTAAAAAYLAVDLGVRRVDASTLLMYRWAAPALVFMLVVWLRLPTRRVLSYVGSRGLAICDVRFRVWPPRQPAVGVLPFANARDLTVSIAHLKGCLEFSYVWRGHDGRELLRLARRYRATPDGQRPADPGEARFYDFCRAAERSWTLFVVESAKGAIRAGQAVSFPVYTPNCSELRVQDGNLVFRLSSGDAVVPATLLEQVSVADGKVHFTPEEGDIFLPCAAIGNVTVLLLVLQHHLGVSVR